MIAIGLLLALILTVGTNTLLCTSALKSIEISVGSLDINGSSADLKDEVKEIADRFGRWSFFFSITVNHDDIGDAECELIELVEAINSEDKATARIAKSRLIGALRQLRRLSGIGIDSVI